MTTIPTIALRNGVEMPKVGFGVFQIPDPAECEASVLAAISAGYRLVDTAAGYGNEESVGAAIRKSGVPRDQIFVVTKLWISDAGEEKAAAAFQRSLDRLGTDYIDLYLIHQPFGDVYGSWRAMEKILADGHARAIGISNFSPDRMVDLMSFNTVAPMVNQIEVHPYHQQSENIAYQQEKGLQIMAWAPFAENRDNLLADPTLAAIGEAYGKSVPQVILRWQLQRDVIAIPKSVRPDRIQQNLDIFDFELSDDDMATIATLDRGVSQFFSHQDPATVERMASYSRNT